jgi:MFS transporter, SP family, galactose:H+ symporter
MNSKTLLLYTIAAVAATGGLLFGFDTGVINVALPALKAKFQLTPFETGAIVSAVLVGGMTGPFVAGRLTDALGRKKMNLIASVIFVIGSILTAIAPTATFLVVGRLLLGLAIGIVSSSVPLYIAEIAPSEIRGRLVTFFQFAITIGILVSYVVGYIFADYEDGWRYMFWCGFVPAAILFFGMLYVPESPRWLIMKGRDEEALSVLNRLHDAPHVKKEYAEIKHSFANEQQSKGNWKELFSKRLRIPLLIGVGIFCIQQFSGINAIIYYSTEIFNMAGFGSNTTATLATVGVGVVNALSTLVGMKYLDSWGRKPILYVGLVGTACSLATVAFAFYFRDSLSHETLQVLAIGGVYVYIFFFAISLGPLGWLLISEVYPLRIRGFASSMGSFSHWFFDFWVGFTFPIMAATSLGTNGGIFMIYMTVVLLGLFFAKYVVFETKGLSLEQIEEKFS